MRIYIWGLYLRSTTIFFKTLEYFVRLFVSTLNSVRNILLYKYTLFLIIRKNERNLRLGGKKKKNHWSKVSSITSLIYSCCSVKWFTLIFIKHCIEQNLTDLLLFLAFGVKCRKESFCTFVPFIIVFLTS